MGLYLENGFCDVRQILNRNIPFNFVVGGRGTGKTFGALMDCLVSKRKFCLMRRTQSQLETIARLETNPFKSVIAHLGADWDCLPVPAAKSIWAYYKTTYEDGKPVYGELLGYAVALSTIANLRGFDMSDVELLIYDEFIPETHERTIKHESDAFFNAYETINRNRELQGRKPLQVLCLANANDFANPIFIGLGLVSTVERMLKDDKTEYVNPQKGIAIYLLTDSPVSTQKRQTALYRLTEGSAFHDMSVSNAFAGQNDPDVYSVNLQEYSPLVGIGELCVYKHKSTRLYFISSHYSGSIARFSGDGIDMQRFFATHKGLLMAATSGRCIYESHLCKALFLRYCGFE